MPKINHYEDINKMDVEAKKDYVDRHSPFVYCDDSTNAGAVFNVKVQVGKEYSHPDDFDHYVSSIALYNGETKLAEATFFAGALGGQDKKGQATVNFSVVLDKDAKLVAHSYCTKHGLWESPVKKVSVA